MGSEPHMPTQLYPHLPGRDEDALVEGLKPRLDLVHVRVRALPTAVVGSGGCGGGDGGWW